MFVTVGSDYLLMNNNLIDLGFGRNYNFVFGNTYVECHSPITYVFVSVYHNKIDLIIISMGYQSFIISFLFDLKRVITNTF